MKFQKQIFYLSVFTFLIPQLYYSSIRVNDSLSKKTKNSVYLEPAKTFGDIMLFRNFWIAGGVRKNFNDRYFVDLFGGGIFYSSESGNDILNIPAKKSSGYTFGFELGNKFKKKSAFYYSLNLYYKYTNVSVYSYNVFRTVIASTPKIGVVSEPLKYGIRFDFSFGVGVRRVSSTNSHVGILYDGQPDIPMNKPFSSGAIFFPNVMIEFKIHKSF